MNKAIDFLTKLFVMGTLISFLMALAYTNYLEYMQ